MPAPIAHEKHILALDGLRGVTALLILFHHILLTQPDFAQFEWHSATTRPHGVFEWLMFDTPISLAWAGQERAILFFVLSGFVLSLPWFHGHPRRYRVFLLQRFWRLYPPYLAAMLVACLGAAVLGGYRIPGAGLWFNDLGWSQPLSWRAIPSILLLTNGPASNWVDESVWTLVWEARVVLIFPCLIIPVRRWKNAGIVGVLALLTVINPTLKLLLPTPLTETLTAGGTVFLYSAFFVLGAAIALNQAELRDWLSSWHGTFGMLIFAVGLAMFWIHWPIQNARLDGLAAGLVLSASFGWPVLAHALEARFLLWIGKISYSLYLIHVPVILSVVVAYRGRVSLTACAALVPVCIGLAALFRVLVEAPSARLMRGRAARSSAMSPQTPAVLPLVPLH
jgi:peptidoglycan/LPS O-acetylase OafA/YrhL